MECDRRVFGSSRVHRGRSERAAGRGRATAARSLRSVGCSSGRAEELEGEDVKETAKGIGRMVGKRAKEAGEPENRRESGEPENTWSRS
jgi:hypothetical protein